MSKYVKNLVADHIRNRLTGINDALLVNVIGIESNAAMKLRTELRAKNINLLVVKNSLAARAVAGTPLDGLFEDATGSAAICWGAADIVSLAKEVTRLIRSDAFKPLEPRGGVMDGSRLSAAQIAEVAKWPSRQEQISMVVGQILGPGGRVAGQICGPGGALASQIKQKGEGEEEGAEGAEGSDAAAAPAEEGPSAEPAGA